MATLTNRQIISDIITDLRAVNLDEKISKRYIHHKLRDYAALFIKRDADLRRMLALSDLWLQVSCVELCEAPIVECCNIDIPGCKFVMKSRHKIPKVYQTLYKELIQVFNVQFSKEFHQITPQEYKDILVREYKDSRIKYFWLQNDYLVVPDALVDTIVIRGVFLNPADAKKLDSCSEEDEGNCTGLLDEPFICPDYLLAVVKQETLKDLFNYYKRNVLDESPNLNTNLKVNNDQ